MVIVTHDDDFLTFSAELEHKGIVFLHQQKYSIRRHDKKSQIVVGCGRAERYEKSCGILINLLE